MTMPLYFPSLQQAASEEIASSCSSPELKPRLSVEDEEGVQLLLNMRNPSKNEGVLPVVEEKDALSTATASTPSITLGDSIQDDEDEDRDCMDDSANDSASLESSWNPTRTVSIDEDAASSFQGPHAPTQFVDFHCKNLQDRLQSRQAPSSSLYFQTPVVVAPKASRVAHHHRPAVITPVRSMPRPVLSFTTPANHGLYPQPFPQKQQEILCRSFHALPSMFEPKQPRYLMPRGNMYFQNTGNQTPSPTLTPSVPSSGSSFSFLTVRQPTSPNDYADAFAPPITQTIEIPEQIPKLPPLLSMKLAKRNRKRSTEMECRNSSSVINSSISEDSREESTTIITPTTPSNAEATIIEKKRPIEHSSPVAKKLKKKMKKSPKEEQPPSSPTTNKRTVNRKIHSSTGKKFSWKNYPELEDFLIANRPEYLEHSEKNYSLEQKDYNNALTARLVVYAEECGYGNLIQDHAHDFGSFTSVRDRIRGYYKSQVQSSRRREQRRRKKLQKLQSQVHSQWPNTKQQHHHH